MSEFLDMGGYAAFVWPSYAVTALVLIAVFVSSHRFLKSTERELESLQREMIGKAGKEGKA